jgi:hypothetical protein
MTRIPEQELSRVERDYPEGLTTAQIFAVLEELGLKLSEPTFRKYVQLGLLPRSKRVGQKGKHKGSQGVYPVSTVRRIAEIKALMEGDLTLEEIASRVLRFRAHLDSLDEAVAGLTEAFLEELRKDGLSEEARRALSRDVEGLERLGAELLTRAQAIEARLADSPRSEAAAPAEVIGLRRA